VSRPRRVFVNEAFRPQRVSGQQRYATEISDRLPREYVRLRPEGFWARGKIQTWLWVQTVLPLRSWRGVLVSMTARAPIWHPRHVVVIHDLFVLEHPEWFSRSYYLTHSPLQRFQMATARALVAVSEPVAAQIRSRRRSARVEVAPNAPSAVFAENSDEDAGYLAEQGLTAGSFLVTVGSLEPRKNLARLSHAYARLPLEVRERLPLLIVGAGADVFARSDVEWSEGIRLTGYVSDPQLRALYGGAKAVVFVSLAEGFGLPLVEAVASGTKSLLVSDRPVFRWICADSALYVDPLDVQSIALGLEAVADGETAGSAPDIDRFSWETSSRAVASVADDAAGQRSS